MIHMYESIITPPSLPPLEKGKFYVSGTAIFSRKIKRFGGTSSSWHLPVADAEGAIEGIIQLHGVTALGTT